MTRNGPAADGAGERPETMTIEKVERDSKLAAELLRFVESCSWEEAKEHIADLIRTWAFTDWETMFAAVRGSGEQSEVIGMASALKTDYYPLADIFPWVSCLFVTEAYRGRQISGALIAYANCYLREQGFSRSYIPTEFTGLYEHYGYRFLREIVNYGGDTDRLYVKELK